VEHLRSLNVWFASAAQAVGWFCRRRQVAFEASDSADGGSGVKLRSCGERFDPPLTVRLHRPQASGAGHRTEDVSWTGESELCIATERVLEGVTTGK
jgi:hypothetical protein